MNGKYIRLPILTLLLAGLVAVGYGEVKTDKIILGSTGGSLVHVPGTIGFSLDCSPGCSDCPHAIDFSESNRIVFPLGPKRTVPLDAKVAENIKTRPLRDRKLRARIAALKKRVKRLEAKLEKNNRYQSDGFDEATTQPLVSEGSFVLDDLLTTDCLFGGSYVVIPKTINGVSSIRARTLGTIQGSVVFTPLQACGVQERADGFACPDCAGLTFDAGHTPEPCASIFPEVCAVSHPRYLCRKTIDNGEQ